MAVKWVHENVLRKNNAPRKYVRVIVGYYDVSRLLAWFFPVVTSALTDYGWRAAMESVGSRTTPKQLPHEERSAKSEFFWSFVPDLDVEGAGDKLDLVLRTREHYCCC